MKKFLMGVLLMACVLFMGSKDVGAYTYIETKSISGDETKFTSTFIGTDYLMKASCSGGEIFGGAYSKDSNKLLTGGFVKKGNSITRSFDESIWGQYTYNSKGDPTDGAYAKISAESWWIFKAFDKGTLKFYAE